MGVRWLSVLRSRLEAVDMCPIESPCLSLILDWAGQAIFQKLHSSPSLDGVTYVRVRFIPGARSPKGGRKPGYESETLRWHYRFFARLKWTCCVVTANAFLLVAQVHSSSWPKWTCPRAFQKTFFSSVVDHKQVCQLHNERYV